MFHGLGIRLAICTAERCKRDGNKEANTTINSLLGGKAEKSLTSSSTTKTKRGLLFYVDSASLLLLRPILPSPCCFSLTMGRGKYKSKPTGRRQFSTPEDMRYEMVVDMESPVVGMMLDILVILAVEAEHKEEEESEEGSEQESGDETDDEDKPRRKGTQGIIEIENPNLVKPKTLKARDIDIGKTTELSRREREEIEKQKAHERYMRLQEQGKTEQARKDLERLSLIRQQRAEAAKKREEEKAAKEQKKAEARK
ncbi:28 kDa heat- and acid-stable phosphoprotein, partial [Cucurbita argyrosperma subsp. argyrosperma]